MTARKIIKNPKPAIKKDTPFLRLACEKLNTLRLTNGTMIKENKNNIT
ncbi:hypothetical protein PQ460_04305 [Paenibacillus sp. KACC 21273]|nr:hypothetical protein [Paenibacillus sp. KACC 21273]WDF51683.1 hypothetical protein PQ460_04305 [Paenibacillus sp. KACC 21273]